MTRRTGWSQADIGDQSGRTFVITGANGGIGLEAARALARRGARLILACRNLKKAEAALIGLREEAPRVEVQILELDLSDLASVRSFAEQALAAAPRIDVLINNAGIMAIPRRTTRDGFEMQLGTNHLGHFALTGLLLPALVGTAGSRVVTVSSAAHRMGRIYFDDLQLERGYGEWKAYGQSKLANLLFAFELDRRLRRASYETRSLACHPGYASTDLQHVAPRETGNRLMGAVMGFLNGVVAQSAADGALPTLRAAVDPAAQGGECYGPGGPLEFRGAPVRVEPADKAHDLADAERLWGVSEELTGVRYQALDASAVG